MTMTKREQIEASDWEMKFALIEAEADLILAKEGAHHVRGVFFASEVDATTARMVEAERRISRGEDRRSLYAKSPICEKCKERIDDIADAIVSIRVSGAPYLIHRQPLCYDREIRSMIESYVARPRSVERVAS